MRSLGRAFPFLFAARWPPQTADDLVESFQQLYTDLEKPGPLSKEASPTLRFSYVSPPLSDGTSTWASDGESGVDQATLVPSEKPVALYIPGLDGYGISAARNQFDDLANTFELWRLFEREDDRSSFFDVVTAIVDFVEEIKLDKNNQRRDVVLIGESCGGVLAAAAAIKLNKKPDNPLKGLVLANPATSFLRTQWSNLLPGLVSLESIKAPSGSSVSDDQLSAYGVLGSLILSFLIPDVDQMRQIAGLILDLPTMSIPPSLEQSQELLEAQTKAFRNTETMLPGELLQHRVREWLTVGVPLVNERLGRIDVPTLVVVGERDTLLPSAEEADRLLEAIPSAEKLLVKNRGHFALDSTVNLTEAILYSNIDPLNWKETKKRYDPITDWTLPPPERIEETIEQSVKPLLTAHSPVYFTTDDKGKRWKGLSRFPKKTGPLLIVGNHQLFGIDLRLIFYELLNEKGLTPRGLAHPIVFSMGGQSTVNELRGRTAGLKSEPSRGPSTTDFQAFGAVPVTPRNFYKLMQTNQTALLFPGGAREALTAKRDYPLFWPDKTDFVRTAARFNATVLTLAAIGMADSGNAVVEAEDVYDSPIFPFLEDALTRDSNNTVRNARFDKQKERERMLPSIVAPGIPARNYFLFGQARDLTELDHNDFAECEKVYKTMRNELRTGIDDLLKARERDPFGGTPTRVLYEQVWRRQAPTFAVEELNKK